MSIVPWFSGSSILFAQPRFGSRGPGKIGFLWLAACLVLCGSWKAAGAQSKAPSITSFSITSGNTPVTSVASGAVVTLTATVSAGSTSLTVGQVSFCDASVSACTDIHQIGTAQLTKAGTAQLKFRPGAGNHSY